MRQNLLIDDNETADGTINKKTINETADNISRKTNMKQLKIILVKDNK